jgi:maleate isomerase
MTGGYYGRNGALGLATPQANPTAETEFRALMPQGVTCATVRMVSAEPDPATRLRAYFTDIAETLNRFDTLAMQAVGLACTGSSYLLGHDAVEASLAKLSARREQPIVSAACAIERALAHLGAHSLALICPYPQWLLDAADTHWQSRGFKVVDQVSLDPGQGDTRAIYGLSPRDAAERIKYRWQNRQADAYLITGTGLPTLRAVAELSEMLPGPVLSSNLCLAWATLQVAGIDLGALAPTTHMPLLAGWEARIDQL